MWKYIGIVAVLLLTLAGRALADSPIKPFSYREEAGRYLFIMLAPGSEPVKAPNGTPYPSSGLYRSDGSAVPLWTVDWWWPGVIVSPDGHHLARVNPSPPLGSYGAPAVTFYEDGRLLKEYRVSDLVQHPERMPESVSAFHWWDEQTVTPDVDRLLVTTKEGRTFEFAIATGTIVSTKEPPPVGVMHAAATAPPATAGGAANTTVITVGAGVVVALAAAWLLLRRGRRPARE